MSQMTKFKIEMSAHRNRIRRWAAHFERPTSTEWLKPKPNQQDNASIFCIISQKLSKALIFAGGWPSEFANSTFARPMRRTRPTRSHLPARVNPLNLKRA
jgi:hypothetical protein